MCAIQLDVSQGSLSLEALDGVLFGNLLQESRPAALRHFVIQACRDRLMEGSSSTLVPPRPADSRRGFSRQASFFEIAFEGLALLSTWKAPLQEGASS